MPKLYFRVVLFFKLEAFDIFSKYFKSTLEFFLNTDNFRTTFNKSLYEFENFNSYLLQSKFYKCNTQNKEKPVIRQRSFVFTHTYTPEKMLSSKWGFVIPKKWYRDPKYVRSEVKLILVKDSKSLKEVFFIKLAKFQPSISTFNCFRVETTRRIYLLDFCVMATAIVVNKTTRRY